MWVTIIDREISYFASEEAADEDIKWSLEQAREGDYSIKADKLKFVSRTKFHPHCIKCKNESAGHDGDCVMEGQE